MRRSASLLPLALAIGALAAGCGSSGSYSLEKTRGCLEQQPGVNVRAKVDFVASTALGGALNAAFPKNQVTISFGLDRDEAQRLVLAYRRFRGKNIGLADVLRPERNAVMLWALHPTEDDLKTVRDCLK